MSAFQSSASSASSPRVGLTRSACGHGLTSSRWVDFGSPASLETSRAGYGVPGRERSRDISFVANDRKTFESLHPPPVVSLAASTDALLVVCRNCVAVAPWSGLRVCRSAASGLHPLGHAHLALRLRGFWATSPSLGRSGFLVNTFQRSSLRNEFLTIRSSNE